MSIENIELEKFINEASEHLRRRSAEISKIESHIKKLCDFLGEEKVKVITANYKYPRPLKEIIDVLYLSKELKRISEGNRADMIFEFEDFCLQYLKTKEEIEQDQE